MIGAEKVDYESYIETLSPRNTDRFLELYESKYNGINYSGVETEVIDRFSLRCEPKHKMTTHAAGAFHPKTTSEGTESGFKFVSVSPFSFADSENRLAADILLARHTPELVYLCFVSCEPTNKESEWISNINSINHCFQNNKSELVDHMNINHRSIEEVLFVSLSSGSNAKEVNQSIISRNIDPSNHSIWKVDTSDRWLTYHTGDEFHQDLHDKVSKKLNTIKMENPDSYRIGSHPVFPLRRISFEIVKQNIILEQEVEEFDRKTFKSIFTESTKLMFNNEEYEDVISDEVDRLLNEGIKAGFVTDDRDEIESEKDYKFVWSGPREPDHAENKAEERYIENIPEWRLAEQAFNEAYDEFDRDSNLRDFN